MNGLPEYLNIALQDMIVTVRIGVHPHEKSAPQRLCVSLEVFLEPDAYLKDAVNGRYLDYAPFHAAITAWQDRSHVELLETYIEELVKMGFQDRRVTAVKASIRKMDVFPNSGGAILKVFRRRTSVAQTN